MSTGARIARMSGRIIGAVAAMTPAHYADAGRFHQSNQHWFQKEKTMQIKVIIPDYIRTIEEYEERVGELSVIVAVNSDTGNPEIAVSQGEADLWTGRLPSKFQTVHTDDIEAKRALRSALQVHVRTVVPDGLLIFGFEMAVILQAWAALEEVKKARQGPPANDYGDEPTPEE